MNTSIRKLRPYTHARETYGAYADIYYKHANKQLMMYGLRLPTYLEINNISKNPNREREYPKYKTIYKNKF